MADDYRHLSESIVALVLSWLPLDVVTRFRSVCTSWNQFISDPHFQSLNKRHHHADHERIIGFYHGSKTGARLKFESFSSTRNHEPPASEETAGFKFYATAEGLLVYIIGKEYYVRNPMTSYNVRISAPPPPRGELRLMYCGLAVSCNKYEIVSISISTELTLSAGFIYSSSTGSWTALEIDEAVFRQLSSPGRPIIRTFPESLNAGYPQLNSAGAASLGPSLHWLFDDGRILAFQLEERRWKVIKSPAIDRFRKGDREAISQQLDMRKRLMHKTMIMFRVDFDLKEHLYPNVWLGSVGAHLYLLIATERAVQLWILEDYEGEEWKMIVEIKGCRSTAPLFFDGRRIAVAPFEEWKDNEGVVKFFDTFSMNWEKTRLDIDDISSKIQFFFPYVHKVDDYYFGSEVNKV